MTKNESTEGKSESPWSTEGDPTYKKYNLVCPITLITVSKEKMVTKEQIRIMRHALGGTNPYIWYKNHYAVDDRDGAISDLKILEKRGYMKQVYLFQRRSVFKVTTDGLRFLRSIYKGDM